MIKALKITADRIADCNLYTFSHCITHCDGITHCIPNCHSITHADTAAHSHANSNPQPHAGCQRTGYDYHCRGC